METDKKYCPHCKDHVAERLFYKHKTKFYSKLTGLWQTNEDKTQQQTDNHPSTQHDQPSATDERATAQSGM